MARAQSVALAVDQHVDHAARSRPLARPDREQQRARRQPRMLHGVADLRGRAIDGVDRGEPLGAAQSVELFGHPPCLLAGGHQAEADDRFIVTPPDAVDEVEPRRHLVEGALAAVDRATRARR